MSATPAVDRSTRPPDTPRQEAPCPPWRDPAVHARGVAAAAAHLRVAALDRTGDDSGPQEAS